MFYLFHGEDAFAQQETLTNLLGKMGDPDMLSLNTMRLAGSVSFGALRHACDVIPFLAKRRVVIVEGLFAARPDERFLKQLYDYLPTMPDSARLFFLEKRSLPANHRLMKLAQKADNGYVRRFDKPEGAALNGWIKQRVESQGGQITPRAIHALATDVGNDLAILQNEIDKLILYRGVEQQINADDVALRSPYVAEASIFDLVDAIGNRNARQAALLLQKKLSEGADAFYLFAMFVRQFRLLLQVRELMDAGERPPAIAQKLKIHSFVANKLTKQANGFSMEQLEQIYVHLLEIDVGAKSGATDMKTSLDLFVAVLTA